jgi:hypothetical protein
MLSFVHASDMAHGAVLPAHLLVQENEVESCAGDVI